MNRGKVTTKLRPAITRSRPRKEGQRVTGQRELRSKYPEARRILNPKDRVRSSHWIKQSLEKGLCERRDWRGGRGPDAVGLTYHAEHWNLLWRALCR